MANKRIKDLATLKYKGFMALDDVDGTGKMDVDTIFNNFAREFDENADYEIGDTVMKDGIKYVFGVSHNGAWAPTDVIPCSGKIVKKSAIVETIAGSEQSGYYYYYGQFVSNAGYRSRKLRAAPDTVYHFIGDMYGHIGICEFDKGGNFIQGHRLNIKGHYYFIEFKTAPNAWIIAVSYSTDHGPGILQARCDSNRCQTACMILDDSRPTDCVDIEYLFDGYTNTSGNRISNVEFRSYVANVMPSCGYTYYGTLYGSMAICEYDKDGNFVKANIGPVTNVNYSRLHFVTSDKTTSVIVSIRSTTEVPLLVPSFVNYNKQAKKYMEQVAARTSNYVKLTKDSTESGYINRSGVVTASADNKTDKFSVKPNHRYVYIGYMYAEMAICEFDKNDTFIRSHSNSATQMVYEFVTTGETKYVKASIRIGYGLNSGLEIIMLDLGFMGFVIPTKFYGTVGIEKNIYYDRFNQLGTHTFVFPGSSVGEIRDKSYRVNPDSVQNVTLHISCYDSSGKGLFEDFSRPQMRDENEQLSILKIKMPVNPETAKNILWVGDSISDYQNSAKYVKEIFDGIVGGIAPTFIGTRHTTGTPDESYAGRNTDWLITSSDSPFVNGGVFDMSAYNTVVGVSGIDVLVMQMGYNDVGLVISRSKTLAQIKTMYQSFITGVKSANPGVKIVWLLPPYNGKLIKSQDVCKRIHYTNEVRNIVQELAIENNDMLVSDAFYCIDSENGYPLDESSDIANVYSSLGRTEKYCSDSVHPTSLGCKEWAINVFPAIVEALA